MDTVSIKEAQLTRNLSRNPLEKNPHPFDSPSAQAWREVLIAEDTLKLALERYAVSCFVPTGFPAGKTCADCLFYQGFGCEITRRTQRATDTQCADFEQRL